MCATGRRALDVSALGHSMKSEASARPSQWKFFGNHFLNLITEAIPSERASLNTLVTLSGL